MTASYSLNTGAASSQSGQSWTSVANGTNITIASVGSNNLWIRFSAQPTQPKLELGTSQTTFVPRLYGQELALCQRYYYQITGGGTNTFASVGSGNAATATVAAIVTPLPVSMRTSPTVNYVGGITIDCGAGSTGTISSMSTVYGGTGMIWYTVNTSGLTAGKGAVVYTSNGTSNYMTFSSEL
jgi:hypothetical protein